MSRCTTFAAALLAGSVLLTVAALAEGSGRWTTGTPMPSSRTEIAVAEVSGKIYVVAAFAASANSRYTIPLPTYGAEAPPSRAPCITRGRWA
jgi:hypothetical protein